jgi:ankyrin repeat protein
MEEYYNEIVQNLDKPDKLSELLSVDIDRVDDRGRSVLHRAVICNDVMVMNHLLQNRAAINKTDNFGWTALHFASVRGSTDECRILLRNEAKCDIQATGGWTALHMAVMNVHYDVALLLLRNGARSDIGNIDGHDALCCANAEAIRQAIIKYRIMLPMQQCAKHIEQTLGKTDLYERNIWRIIWPYI